jgi:hypothetical protein
MSGSVGIGGLDADPQWFIIFNTAYGLSPFFCMQLLYVSMAALPGSAAAPLKIWSRGSAALALATHSRIALSRADPELAGAAETAVAVTTAAAHRAIETNHSVRM